nr:MAG TPA: hypothetical protein [Caudoviricetes sp.]
MGSTPTPGTALTKAVSQTHRKRKHNARHNIRHGHPLDRVPYA